MKEERSDRSYGIARGDEKYTCFIEKRVTKSNTELYIWLVNVRLLDAMKLNMPLELPSLIDVTIVKDFLLNVVTSPEDLMEDFSKRLADKYWSSGGGGGYHTPVTNTVVRRGLTSTEYYRYEVYFVKVNDMETLKRLQVEKYYMETWV